MNQQDKIQRELLPIPDIPHVGLTTYDHLISPEERLHLAMRRQ